jgi:hypothetical protein
VSAVISEKTHRSNSIKSLFIRFAVPVIDLFLCPFLLLFSLFSRLFRFIGSHRLPASRRLLRTLGVWPIRRHYYDPLFDPNDLSYPQEAARPVLGLDWNLHQQLAILKDMRFASELSAFLTKSDPIAQRFSFQNESFLSGDADYLYSFVRTFKPLQIIEVGCGNSTRLIHAAIMVNKSHDAAYQCRHTCIEPYEVPWLDELGVEVIRERVERLPIETFSRLSAGDLLFIDSSHMIRPCGDVLFEILQVLPILRPGVFVHFHDIFTPRNYLPDWLEVRTYLWNEQYLLEAFLCNNSWYKIIGSLNHLHHTHYKELSAICAQHSEHFEPGSFYIQRC